MSCRFTFVSGFFVFDFTKKKKKRSGKLVWDILRIVSLSEDN